MAIKVRIDAEWVKYVPEFAGNRDQSEAEQISCLVKYVSQEDQDKLTDEIIGQSRDGFRRKSNIKWSRGHASMVNSHVKDIKNVSTVKDGQEVPVSTMAEMYKIPELKGLYSELVEALDASNKLDEAEVKN